MKRLWVSVALLAALVGLATIHISALGALTGRLTGWLEQARGELIEENWEQAQGLVEGGLEEWERRGVYLHTTLRHTDIDTVRASFHEALAYLSAQEDASECAAVCARLINQLELLYEGELPSLKNLL